MTLAIEIKRGQPLIKVTVCIWTYRQKKYLFPVRVNFHIDEYTNNNYY